MDNVIEKRKKNKRYAFTSPSIMKLKTGEEEKIHMHRFSRYGLKA